MAAKRIYASKKGGSVVREHKNSYNDEQRSDSRPYEMAPEFGRGANYFPTMSGEGRATLEKPGMINEDRRAIANLPQEVMIKPYPVSGSYLPEDLDDAISGVDRQINYDDSQRKAHFYPKKV